MKEQGNLDIACFKFFPLFYFIEFDMTGKKVQDFDIIVCKNIKSIRKMIGMTQQMLAKELGITSQQLHKYENGIDRVSTRTLYQMCDIFGCEITDILPKKEVKSEKTMLKVAENSKTFITNNQDINRDMLDIMNAFFDLTKKQQAKVKKIFIDACIRAKLDVSDDNND